MRSNLFLSVVCFMIFSVLTTFAQHFNFNISDESYSIVVKTATCSGTPIDVNDEIGVFTYDVEGNPICGGSVTLGSNQLPVSLAAWKDDSQTSEKDGFATDDTLEFRIWDSIDEVEYYASATYIAGNGNWGYGTYAMVDLVTTKKVVANYFNFHQSDESYSIVVLSATVTGEDLSVGDEIGVFATDNEGKPVCAGAKIIEEGDNLPYGLIAWKDDSQTPQKDGFANNEPMSFQIWKKSEKTAYQVVPSFVQGNGLWGEGTFTMVHLLATTRVPVELSNFEAHVAESSVILQWTTMSEKDNLGFEIERAVDNQQFSKISFQKGHGTTNVLNNYRFEDKNLIAGKYYYRLKQIDINGKYQYSQMLSITVEKPNNYRLLQNYPNPFNPDTQIRYRIPEQQHVSFKIYNMNGQLVAELVNENKQTGEYIVKWNAREQPSGMYFGELKSGNYSQRIKLLLVQ